MRPRDAVRWRRARRERGLETYTDSVSDAVNKSLLASVTTHFARWYGAVVVITLAALVIAGCGPSAAGVAIGSFIFLANSRRVRFALRSPLTGTRPRPGMIVFAATQMMIGAVCLFAGALIKGELLLILSAAFGTWQIASAALVVVVARAVKRDNPET